MVKDFCFAMPRLGFGLRISSRLTFELAVPLSKLKGDVCPAVGWELKLTVRTNS